ncbi:hypothetical protein [Rhodococcus sp. RDE2]|uniref:hypothetical protein n=1 Tax=Rhodococcus sp. RDE2 TaxID=2885078 RepID=UPI001E448018|nr:hypothetical protein [Rhodococcus sp. RDE2]BDB63319.1 hypothetical protein RDE2_51130 [Rhodococcus sp. RDE2]
MIRRALTSVAAFSLVAAVLAGCSSSSEEPAPQPTKTAPTKVMPSSLPALDASTIDTSDPDAVAIAFAETSYTLLPGADPDMNAGMVRAAAVLDPKLAEDIRGQVGRSSPGYEWNRWAQAGAMVDATAAIDTQEVPPQTALEAYRMVRVTQTVENSTRFIARRQLVLLLTLVNIDGEWKVSRLTQL